MQSQRLASVPRSRQPSVLPSFAPPSTANTQALCNSAPSESIILRQQHPETHGMHTPQCKRPNTSFVSELGVLQQRGPDTGTHLGSHRQQRQGGEGGGERLSQLHARLQQEAEKIRQWKTATEMDLKQKDAKLQEALHTVDTQRRALVELQLSNATLESKLRDEVINQEDIRRRIDATREICTLLKNHIARTEDVLAVGEIDKETLHQVDKQRVDEYQALVIKFQDMELEQTSAQETLRDKLVSEEAEKRKVLSGLQLELAAARKRVEALEAEQQRGMAREAGLKTDLERMTEEYHALEQQKLALEHIARNKDESLVEQLSELNTVQSKLKQKEGEALDLQAQLEKAQQHMLSLEQEHHSALDSARAAQELHQQELESLQMECREVEKQLRLVEIELKRMTEERDCLQEDLMGLRKDLGSLEAEKQSCIDTVNQLTVQKEELTRQCNKLAVGQEEAHVKQVDAERQTQETVEELHRTQAALVQAQASLQSITEGQGAVEAELAVVRKALREKETDVDLVKEQLCEALHQRTVSCNKLRTLAEIFNGARIPSPESADIELMVLADYVSESVEGLQRRVEVYQSQRSDLVEQLDKAAKENKDLRSASLKLKDQLKQKSELFNAEQEKQEASLHELKEKLLQKSEELACLQDRLERMEVACSHGEEEVEEAKREKEAVEGKTALLEEERAQLQAETASLQMELRNAQEVKQALEEQIALLGDREESSVSNYQKLSTLNGDLTAELAEKAVLVDKLTGKVEECTAEVERVVQERERSRVEHEQQISDLASTLQMYQVENQKIVDQKDREIASMQEKLEMAQGAESKVEGLQAELAQAISERDQAHVQLQKEQSRAEELEKQATTAPSFKVPANPSAPKALPPESPLSPSSSTVCKTPLRNTPIVNGCGRQQVQSVQGRTQRAPTAPTALSNSSSQRAPTEQRRVGQQEASDGSEEEEECVMEVNRSRRPSHSARKPASPSTPTSVPLYLRDTTNCPPTRPFTPHSYSTPKSSSFLCHLKTPTVPPRASSANFRMAPSPSVRRAPTRGGAPPQSSPHQSPRHTRSKEDSFKKPNQRAPKANSRQATASLKKQPQAWAKKAPPNTRKSSGEKVVEGGKGRKGHGMSGMGMSWFDQNDIFGFGPEQ